MVASNGEIDQRGAVLAGRTYMYALFQNVFGTEPTVEQMRSVCSAATESAVRLFDVGEDSSYHGAANAALSQADAVAGDLEGSLDDLKVVYTRLFLGPRDFKAPAWESMYVTNEPVIFQQTTLDVRNFYRSQGFLPAEYPTVSDDHVALECAFMAKLAQRAAEGDMSAVEPSARFLDEHLLKFVDDYAGKVEASESGFYPAFARLAAEFMRLDRAILDELSD